MAGLTELIQTMNNMQVDAQAALPVTPNNGNPAGANNMPQQPVDPVLQRYPWLAPSRHMASVRQRLELMGNRMAQQPTPPQAQPVLPVQQQQQVPQTTLPVLPTGLV